MKAAIEFVDRQFVILMVMAQKYLFAILSGPLLWLNSAAAIAKVSKDKTCCVS
jgi:hypothetical protein